MRLSSLLATLVVAQLVVASNSPAFNQRRDHLFPKRQGLSDTLNNALQKFNETADGVEVTDILPPVGVEPTTTTTTTTSSSSSSSSTSTSTSTTETSSEETTSTSTTSATTTSATTTSATTTTSTSTEETTTSEPTTTEEETTTTTSTTTTPPVTTTTSTTSTTTEPPVETDTTTQPPVETDTTTATTTTTQPPVETDTTTTATTTTTQPPVETDTTTATTTTTQPPVETDTTTTTQPPVETDTTTATTTTTQPPVETDTTTEPPVTTTTTSTTEPPIETDTTTATTTDTSTATTTTEEFTSTTETPEVDTQFTFLTETTSLFVAPTTTTSEEPDPNITDPDQATSTATTDATDTAAPIGGPSDTPVAPPLPINLPPEIWPAEPLDSSVALGGMTLARIVLKQSMSWSWVVNKTDAATQLLAYTPGVFISSNVLKNNEVYVQKLSVVIPSNYKSTADVALLRTGVDLYMKTEAVPDVQAMLLQKSSAIYQVPGIYAQIAAQIDSSYPITAIVNPLTGAPLNPQAVEDGGSKKRQDAIIGVVTALGVVALMVLVFLVYRSMKRKRELAHHRLSGHQNDFVGVRPEGVDFDQDSVGGQRRRSFYYAEDSLRGFQDERDDDFNTFRGSSVAGTVGATSLGQAQMSQRRNAAPAAISAPILRENSMNW